MHRLNITNATHMLGLTEHSPTALSIKIFFKKSENTRNYTTITQITNIKIPSNVKFKFFFFFKVKDVITLYIKIQKPQNTSAQYFFDSILLLKKLCKIKKTSGQQLYILLILKGKKMYFYCEKKNQHHLIQEA